MMRMLQMTRPQSATQIPEPPIARFLFADTRMAWFWLLVRLYVGYEWLSAGWEKLTGYSLFGEAQKGGAWVFTGHEGIAIKGFVTGALAQAGGPHPAVQGWYAWFLQHVVLPNAGIFAYTVTFGEVLIGLGLIVGCLTGIAAFFGLFMNLNFLLAGTVSINPILGVLAILLVLAWRIAGYYGVDRYLLPLLGTPWTGSLAAKRQKDLAIE
jgi:thiosulfate dehydrogenase [quinone] large subunit